MRIGLLLLLAPLIGGCALAAKVESRQEYQASATQYKACLAANAASPQNCEGQRLAMEVDERKYNALSAGTDPGAQRTGTLTVINR